VRSNHGGGRRTCGRGLRRAPEEKERKKMRCARKKGRNGDGVENDLGFGIDTLIYNRSSERGT
jgi:hypothetical protein